MLAQGPASPLHHRCNVSRCGCTLDRDRSSSRGRARRQLASEGIAKGCLRPTGPFVRAESPLAKAKATNKSAPSTRGRALGTTAQRRGADADDDVSNPKVLDHFTTGTLASDAGCPSPTNNELTDAALLKSQELLERFSSLNLDFDPDAKDSQGCEESMSEISFRSLSPKRSLSAKFSSPKEDDDDGTVKVPKEFMKMMAEMWDEIRVLKASHKPEEDLTSSRLGGASSSEPRMSGCSVTSFTSTASTRSDSHSSRSSPRRDAYFPAPLPPPSTPRRFFKAATCSPTSLASPKSILQQCDGAAMRPRAAATSYCVPASSAAVHVCIPPMAPHTRMAVPHTRAASQTPPCRSISMVQTVTVTTSWTVS